MNSLPKGKFKPNEQISQQKEPGYLASTSRKSVRADGNTGNSMGSSQEECYPNTLNVDENALLSLSSGLRGGTPTPRGSGAGIIEPAKPSIEEKVPFATLPGFQRPSCVGDRKGRIPLPIVVSPGKDIQTFREWKQPEIKQQWITAIKQNGPWSWFVTLTFTSDVKPYYAKKLYRVWLSRLSDALHQYNGSKTRIRWILATEHTYFGRIHLHALVSAYGLTKLHRFRWGSRWEKVHHVCGMARIHIARNRSAPYLVKYVTKGGDLDIGGRFKFNRSRDHN